MTATAGKNAANAGCSTALSTQPGTKLKIQESVPSNETVASTTFNGASVSNTAGLVKVTATTGANIVTYENEPVGPPQTGYVEVCKDPGDDYVNDTATPFQFTVTDKTNVAIPVSVLVNQCSGPIKVAAGNVAIAETPTATTFVSSIFAAPDPNALGPTNLTNGTTTAVVPVSSDSSGEVQVHFVNTTITATLKVCKYLTAGSDALAGKTFTFLGTFGTAVDGGYGLHHFEVQITATAGTTGACKIVTYDDAAGGWVPNESGPIEIPVGATVNVTELLGGYPYVSGDGNPAGQDDNQSTTVVNGINTVSFHNQALGQLEICKAMLVDHKNGVDDSNFNNIAIFHFSIDGATSGPLSDVQVAAGHCSMPLIVNVGQHTITENLARTTVNGKTITLGFAFVSATATGPTGDNRVVDERQPGHRQRAVLLRPGERRRDPGHDHEPRAAGADQGLQGGRARLGDAARGRHVAVQRGQPAGAHERNAEPDGDERHLHRPDRAGRPVAVGRLADHRHERQPDRPDRRGDDLLGARTLGDSGCLGRQPVPGHPDVRSRRTRSCGRRARA